MNRVEQTGQREYCSTSLFISAQDDERGQCNNQNQKNKQRKRRNSSPFSYIEIIAYAILSSPQKRATLYEIYSFIQNNYPSFTEHRLRWKNTVRHNLTLHECFQRGGIAVGNAGCYWHIHPSFVVAFSRGDFSRRKSVHSNNATLGLNGWSSLVENHIVIQRPCLQCCIHKSNPEPSWSNPSFSVTAPMEPLQYHYGSLTPSTAFHSLPTYIGLTGGTNVLPSVYL